ncbi:hypothetical protein OHT61_00100 [Streptomyces sp. NBC_00178]|uniref:hypothetical protein n=1 Tax=Streptomyces sp. NBC_00178 TaxID=2975672 RepID=UPI002E2B08ED|nr:hypothetical protein [Streptomyces sp. NBC_00178]
MTMRKRLAGSAVALSGAALLVGAAVAQPATAATIPWGQANFYSGADYTGTVYPIPATDTQCTNLSEPALSVANFKYASVVAFFGEDCTQPYGNVTGLHQANLPVPVKSYYVIPSWS